MADNKPEEKHEADTGETNSKTERLTPPAFEQEQRRLKVEREAKQTGAGSNDPEQAVNPDG